MRSLSRVFLRLLVVCLLTVTLFAPIANATSTATRQSGSTHARKGIIARILDYVLPDINLPPG
jgi:hypothetical protein